MPQQGIKNFTFHYAVDGRPSDPSLLVLHGFLGSHQDFAGVVPALAERFYCVVPDLPGHGKTVAADDADYGFEAIAHSIIHFLDALNISQTYLLGYSMGGRLALYLVCHFPERFLGVVLESASPGLKTAEERRLRVEKDSAIALRLQTQPLNDFLNQWYSNPLFASLQNHPEAYDAMLLRRQQNRVGELAKVLKGCSTGEMRWRSSSGGGSLWEALPTINTPLLLLVGALDHKFVDINRELFARLYETNQARLIEVKRCGHNVHVETPNDYTDYIVEFCAER